MLVISGIILLTSRDTGYLENLIKGIFSNLLKGTWNTFLFTSRDIGYWYPPPPLYKLHIGIEYLILPMLSYPGCHVRVMHWLY